MDTSTTTYGVKLTLDQLNTMRTLATERRDRLVDIITAVQASGTGYSSDEPPVHVDDLRREWSTLDSLVRAL